MKAGISTVCLQGRYETEDALGLLKELGAQTAEVYLQTFYEYRPEFAKKYAERLAGTEVNSVCVLPTSFEGQLFSDSRRIRGDGFYWLDQVLRSAQFLGAKRFALHGFARTGVADDFDNWAGHMREITSFCARYGVTACLENDAFGLYNRPSVFKELKNRCQDLAAVFDLKQAVRSNYPYTMYLKDIAGSIAYAHISDADESGRDCLPGKGTYNFEEILKRLKGEGFDGELIIETETPCNVDELKTSLEYLKEIIYKIS